MRRSLTTAIGAVLLIIAAAWIAVRFRRLPPAVDLRAMTWDAARHALIGLDLFDHLRRFEPLRLLLRLEEEHWWPPLFGILSLPAYLIGGRQLSSPSLVSLVSYCLIPAIAWLSIRRVTAGVPLLGWGLIALFFLRSPELIEMSTWSMLELATGLFAVAAFCCFLAAPDSRARSWAYGLAGASTLFKYHYGFFLLLTLGAATLAELPHDEFRAVIDSARLRLRRRSTWIALVILGAAIVARRIAETGDPHPWIPSVANLIWIAYMTTLIVTITQWMRTKRAPWAALPQPLQRFITCGLSWPLVWCIDPSNVHAWYRQIHVSSDPPARWIDQIRVIAQYIEHDYSLGPVVLAAVLLGGGLSLAEGLRRHHVGVLALTVHAIWPVALMSLSNFLVESRFLTTFVVCLYTSAAAGWTLFLERSETAPRIAIASALLGLLVIDQAARTLEWKQQLVTRRVYGYISSEPPDRFVRATVKAFSAGQPVVIVLPEDIEVVAPTIRLGLRLALADVPPAAVKVDGGGTALLAKRLRRFPGGLVGVETDPATLRRLAQEAGLKMVSQARGPAVPGHPDRALLISRVER